MRKRDLLLVLVISFASEIRAQFSSSEKVYCYEYQYTIEDGIKSQIDGNVGYMYVVNFQNNMMGICVVKKSEAMTQSSPEEYYGNKARQDLAERYRKWNASGPQFPGIGTTIISYNSQYSSSNRYTYQYYERIAVYNQWGGTKWNIECLSFSSDKQELIHWWVTGSQRNYYKLISWDSLKPNTDFLW